MFPPCYIQVLTVLPVLHGKASENCENLFFLFVCVACVMGLEAVGTYR